MQTNRIEPIACFEWYRPEESPYSGNKLLIIESRSNEGAISDCRMATKDEILWIMQYELQIKILKSLQDIQKKFQVDVNKKSYQD